MKETKGAGLGLICSALLLLTLITCWPATGNATQQFGFGFEPPVYQQASVAGQDGWVNVYGSGNIWSFGAHEGAQYLALQQSFSGEGRVERAIGANVTQSTVLFNYDLFLPSGWLTGFNSCNSTYEAFAEFAVNGTPKDFLAFGVAKAGGSMPHGVSGEGIFLDGNLGAGYRSASYSSYWVNVASLLDSWHNLRVEVSAQNGHAQLFLDNTLLITEDFGSGLVSVDRVAFEQDRYGACDCIQRWVCFDGPPTQVPEASSFAMLLAGCLAMAIIGRRARARVRS